ncbi:MAG: peptidoglycan DD-metalloendopeptidase family protein [Methylobacteriaceae bacterium]|nr:peptidoglycan DD-metalloendopeptidase family protein [Methylobacteriaceae bacterium]
MCRIDLLSGSLSTRRIARIAALAGTAILSAPAGAQAPTEPGFDPVASKKLELRGVEDTLSASAEQRAKIKTEIESIRQDRARLNAALLDATAKVSEADARMAKVEARLDRLTGSEEAIRRSLEGRRAVVAEVLAVLQRMGRRTPPALLVQPEDVLKAIRASMTLGAVLPGLRAETEALASDLRDLVSLRASIATEKDNLAREHQGLQDERARLAALVETRQKSLGEAQSALETEQRRAAELAGQATSLKDLIAKMERESAAARKAAEEARKYDEERKKQAALETQEQQAKIEASPFKDPARLAPAIPFSKARAKLPLPASGEIVKTYGASDAFGSSEKGISIGVRPRATVVSPADGWVLYAGPYRTYGQLLIVNAGDGYYIVLAGMDRVNVAVGQFVLSGEPIGVMGDGATRTASAVAIGASQPILYVEFRKDGSPVDPAPWWSKPDLKKVRG